MHFRFLIYTPCCYAQKQTREKKKGSLAYINADFYPKKDLNSCEKPRLLVINKLITRRNFLVLEEGIFVWFFFFLFLLCLYDVSRQCKHWIYELCEYSEYDDQI